MMNTTEGFVRNLFRNEKPSVSTLNFDDPDVWVRVFRKLCQSNLLNSMILLLK